MKRRLALFLALLALLTLSACGGSKDTTAPAAAVAPEPDGPVTLRQYVASGSTIWAEVASDGEAPGEDTQVARLLILRPDGTFLLDGAPGMTLGELAKTDNSALIAQTEERYISWYEDLAGAEAGDARQADMLREAYAPGIRYALMLHTGQTGSHAASESLVAYLEDGFAADGSLPYYADEVHALVPAGEPSVQICGADFAVFDEALLPVYPRQLLVKTGAELSLDAPGGADSLPADVEDLASLFS